MIELLPSVQEDVIAIRITKEIKASDYDAFVPVTDEKWKTHGELMLYCEMEGIKYITPGAVYRDLRYDIRHVRHFKKIALVGNRFWHSWIAALTRVFVTAEVRYYSLDQRQVARQWIEST